MAYLPKNKYKKLYTSGNEYKIMTTGKPYTGEYIKLNDGRLFAGSDPSNIKGKLIVLSPIRNNNVLNNSKNNKIYSILKKDLSKEQDSYIPILSSSPVPTALDYSNGYFNRYISVRLNTKQYQEISKDIYENFYKRAYNTKLNKIFFIKWNLGENSSIENTKRLRQLEYDLPGIFNFFPNKDKYSLKNGIIHIGNSKLYPNGESIPKNLPISYQLGNKDINEIKNSNVPANQNCAKCMFFENGQCNKWQAPAKAKYWCRAYEIKQNTPTSTSTSTISVDSLISAKQDNPPPQKSSTFTRRGGSY